VSQNVHRLGYRQGLCRPHHRNLPRSRLMRGWHYTCQGMFERLQNRKIKQAGMLTLLQQPPTKPDTWATLSF
jgi:hypothetical protein